MAKAKKISGINCDAAAAEAIPCVLITRFEEMLALRDHALDWSDPEGVHDMRVSSRRLRSALRDFMPFLHKRRLAAALKQIRQVADALGEVRDQDVAIMGVQNLASGAPPEAAAMLDQLVGAREDIRDQARKELQQLLYKAKLKQLQKDFLMVMDSAMVKSTNRKGRSKNAQVLSEVAYREIARRIILQRLKEVEKLSKSLYQPLKIKPLHKMRIAAKRLRYALELFEPCWGTELSPFARKIASLQSSLGELHDSDIWIDTFGEHLSELKKDEDRVAASLWLLSHFVRLHAKHLRNTLGQWRDWEANKFGSRLRDCINPKQALASEVTDSSASTAEPTDNDGAEAVPPAILAEPSLAVASE